ncbi:MAG: class I SAM-dependent methyltransferase [Sphingomonas sp.]|jgi:SAM-dependent methyltransferase|uniref:class I SAM-dependent methyltransferase n=1 Tax=Sphingomonas sp. TaxID=28214 RepID=UPI0035671FEE
MASERSDSQSTREVYDAIAEHYGDRHSGISNPYRKLERFVPSAGRYALDVGCGPGRDTLQLAKHFDRVLGLDVSENMVSLARQAAFSPNIEFRRLDILDLDDGPFDFIWANAILHHLNPDELQRCFDVFSKCSSDACSIAITVRTDIKHGFDDEYPGHPRLYFGYSADELAALAENIGCSVTFQEEQKTSRKAWLFVLLSKG